MAEKLQVEIRETLGKRSTRRLRDSGKTPGIVYGHGRQNVCVSVPSSILDSLVMHGSRLVNLTGAVDEPAFIRDVQWDTWGTKVTHVDFTRISEHEKDEVEVKIELRGEAPGVKDGGVVEHLIHEIPIECPASVIPEKLQVSINSLDLLGTIKVEDLQLPEGANVLISPASVVAQCVEPTVAPEEEPAEAIPGEPEVIGAKEEEKEE